MTRRASVRKPSAAQLRQRHLRMRKGQINSIHSHLRNMLNDRELSDTLRACAGLALVEVREMVDKFNREVGW